MRLVFVVSECFFVFVSKFFYSNVVSILFQHFTRFAVRLGNSIGDAGVKHIADMLKVNTTLVSLALGSELCFDFYFFRSVFRFILFPHSTTIFAAI